MQATTENGQRTSSQDVPIAWVDRIFQEMSAAYGSLFSDRWKDSNLLEVKGYWQAKLRGYSTKELRRGLDAMGTFPPTLPEFLSLCRPKPNYSASYAEAQRLHGRLDGWSDCSVFWAAREIGAHDLKTKEYRDIEGRWKDCIDRAFEERKPIPESKPVAGLVTAEVKDPAKQMTEEEKEQVWARIKSFGKHMTRKPVAGQRDTTSAEVEAAMREIQQRGAA